MSSAMLLRPFSATVQFVRWATKKAAGSTKNGRDSPGQRLGLKKSGGQSVFTGQIIARQRGTKWRCGPGVGIGRDQTLFAKTDGELKFSYHPHLKKTWASVEPFTDAGGLTKLTKAAAARRAVAVAKQAKAEASADTKARRKQLLAEIDAFNLAKLIIP
uniref:50S ribosomal protein L27, chloroplastic n=1 Tax=Spongospora subterranea TaxID=70186 RepID=A0A0H5QKU2_9EUKA|eukprot:CRZ02242.1 hypothetical protein [Spongospora subterranea]